MTTTTATTATNGVMADSQQQLTAPVPTSLQVTPTLTFGDIGTVIETETEGHAPLMHGVGELPDPYLLERMVKLDNVIWTVDDATGIIATIDIDAQLRNYARNADVLNLYQLYHTDYEITVKLNTNQFYQGAIMLTLIPFVGAGAPVPTGLLLSERAVQDPTVLSASTAESVVKTWKWAWPQPWLTLHGTGLASHGLIFRIDNLLPLRVAKTDMSEEIDIQIWARFVNIKLSYPIGPLPEMKSQAQSARGPQVAIPRGRKATHPAQDPLSGLADTASEVVQSVVSAPAKIADGLIGAADSVLPGIGALIGGFLDKPDQADGHETMVIDAAKDLFNCDIPANSTNISLYKARYVDPSPSRMPLTKSTGWTLLDFAKIPGLLDVHEFAGNLAPALTLSLIKPICLDADHRTPLEYATKCCHLFRGSVRVALQFFCSSFVTARFVVQFDTGEGFPASYDYGLAKVINVKGDTVDTFTIPWMDTVWWRDKDRRRIQISLASGMVSSDTTTDPVIGLLVWVAAADDFLFAFPSLPTSENWQPIELSQAQAAIGQLFQAEFPAIVDDVFYDTDKGYSNNESIDRMSDLAKRLTLMNPDGAAEGWNPLRFDVQALDQQPTPGASQLYQSWVAFRSTFYGAMRACFMMQSGGYHLRAFRISEGDLLWRVLQDIDVSSTRDLFGTVYPHPFDSVAKLIVPQVTSTPYRMYNQRGGPNLSAPIYGLTVEGVPAVASFHAVYIGARDDVQFGYPILPTGVPRFELPMDSVKASKTQIPSVELMLKQSCEKFYRTKEKDNRKVV